jgi:two-component system cell cycle sensor histidine kinase/response regulator CckA
MRASSQDSGEMDTVQMHGQAQAKRAHRSADIWRTAEKVSATIGIEFFQSMVRHLAVALAADGVFIGEFIAGQVERIRILAASNQDERRWDFEYPLAGSAVADAALGKQCLCRTGARNAFPDDAMLPRFEVEAFVGVPLMNNMRQSLGVLMAVYHKPVRGFQDRLSMLEIFAPRATAELSRKQADEKLHQSEERYRTFIAANPDGMWRVELDPPVPVNLPPKEQAERIHRDGYIAECNDAIARFLGRKRASELIGCRVSEVIGADTDPSVHRATVASAESGYSLVTVETRSLDRSGKQHYRLRSQWGVVEDGALCRIWGITRDITELRNSELELEASEQRLADLLEAVHMVVVMLDPDGSITFCNDYLLGLTNWNFEDIAGRNWFELMIPERERATMQAVLVSSNELASSPIHLESTLLGPDGRCWWINWDFTWLFDVGGKVSSAVFVGRDATEYKRLEAQFRQSQKLESVGRLAGGVAHDFNNLLTVILGYSSALLTDRDPADSLYIPLAEIKKAAEKGSELAYQLLTFSSHRLVQPALLSLNTLIIEDQRMLKRVIGENVELVTHLDPALGNVQADNGHVRQILMNLAVNARDAMPQGGKLIVSTSNTEASGNKSAHSKKLPPGSYVLLTVADTGVGMSETVLDHLFEPFFTTKPPGKGTGLGLSTVYGILQENGGYIFVDTTPNEGSTFSLFFPRIDAAVPIPQVSPKSSLKGGTESILLVEDYYNLRVLTAKVLRQLGYTVWEAESPGHALELAQQSGTHFDLILTDVVMPQMSGGALAGRVRVAQPAIKTLLMSGYAENSGSEDLTDEPYIQKPFAPETLGEKVREVLDRR